MGVASLRADEVEALKAIYGDELMLDEDVDSLWIDLKASSCEERCVVNADKLWDKHIRLEFKLPSDYPTTAPPVYTISAPWMSRNKKLLLTSAMEQIYAENAGDAILYQWIEKARDFLNEGIADIPEHDHDTNSDEEPTPSSDVISAEKVVERVAEKIHITHGEAIMDRKSTFQAHLAKVKSVDHAKKTIRHIKENKKLATATHNISAYRISGGPHGTCFQDCDDDGENAAGSRLLSLMEILGVTDVVIVVSRWFGGTQLGADRFKLINNVARELMDKCGVIKPKQQPSSGTKEATKKKKSK